ncbi:hypothetical protein ABZ826_37555 [Streptomyces sp. NPDC047515]|uniref:hypothetical protein n=1 Tax=Streptomyces sp. NPDC047515 TaxID=3155380 RepID=UPI0033C04764
MTRFESAYQDRRSSATLVQERDPRRHSRRFLRSCVVLLRAVDQYDAAPAPAG